MILKNPITGIALSESELSYFVKLKLDASWITEDWIANNVPIEEIEQFVVLHLNETKRSHRFFKNSKYKKKLKKYLVKECYLMESDKTEVYRLSDGNLILSMSCKNLLKVIQKFKNKKNAMKDIYSILNIKLVVSSCKIMSTLIEISIRSELD
ncbi:hypothetical protein CPT03_11530 [Pedobacter ginsengisoli]|uniref:Uncharacterized protein n=1 Tax=Pedobacter ginsengisoli TaxID=363852 RepID=A0A2D1U618_9SPHI|nr:hypothetical protein [Pedobacter ginsengisoli]ATP57061.1 hypothetical protein CPT03_11530 [Pedobacter ginsengisoli]